MVIPQIVNGTDIRERIVIDQLHQPVSKGHEKCRHMCHHVGIYRGGVYASPLRATLHKRQGAHRPGGQRNTYYDGGYAHRGLSDDCHQFLSEHRQGEDKYLPLALPPTALPRAADWCDAAVLRSEWSVGGNADIGFLLGYLRIGDDGEIYEGV